MKQINIYHLVVAFVGQGALLWGVSASWSDANGNWSVAANWTTGSGGSGVPSSSGDTATMSNGGTSAAHTITLDADETVGAVVIDFGNAYTVADGGHTLSFQDPSGTTTITVNTTNGTAAHSILTPVKLNNPIIVSQNATGASGTLTIGPGAISAASTTQTLTKTGDGILVLSGTNTYSGGTTISGGTISITAEANLGPASASATIGDATLLYNASFTTTREIVLTGTSEIDVGSTFTLHQNGVVSGAGSLTVGNSGTLVLGETNTYQGGTTLTGGSAGTLSISNDNNLGDTAGGLTLDSGTLLTSSGITSARSVTIAGGSTLDTSGNTDTFSGTWSGSGALTINGGGTVILSGTDNSYSGDITLSAASTTLQGTTNSVIGSVDAGAGTFFTLSQSVSGTYAGTLSGAGTMTKSGSGAVTLTASSTSFTGNTNVTAGTLVVDGSIANSAAVTISSGATLGGGGTVGPTTSNSGTIDPGSSSSLGTLSIAGALTLNGTSTVNIDFAPTTTDKVAATGAASLTGATLTLTPKAGFYSPTFSYTVLTSSTLGGTTFTNAYSTSSNFTISLDYSSTTSVVVDIHALTPFFNFPYRNQNTRAVGENINALSAASEISPGLQSVLDTFLGQSDSAINNALDQMHPAPYSAYNELQEELGAQIISLFHRRPRLSCGNCACNPNRFWVRPYGDSLNDKHHGEEFGFTANSGGLTAGVDREIGDRWIVGIGGCWNNTHLSWHQNHGHGEVNGYYGAFYTDYQIWNFYLGGAVLAGADFYDTSRHINFFSIDEHAHSHFRGLDVMAQFSMAYYFGFPSALVYPYAHFDYFYLQLPGFTESGATVLDLDVQARTSSTLRTEMGLAFSVQDSNVKETLCIAPLFSIGWVNMCPLERPNFNAHFVGESIPFTTYGWDQTWNLLSLGFHLDIDYRCFTFGINYNVEMSADKETLLYNHNGDLRFNWNW